MSFFFPLSFTTWLVPLGAFCICWLTLAFLMQRASRLPMDHPNARSLHITPTPRVGGVGVMLGILLASTLMDLAALWPILLGAVVLAAISLLDDYKGLPAHMRLLAHIIVVIAWLWTFPHWSGAHLLAAGFAIVWTTNLYNFMDGADGLAGGMTVIGFGALAIAAGWCGAPELALLCTAIVGAALAFLRFNFPPAKLFMGDTGSIPLGFLAAVVGVYGVAQNLWPVLFPVMVFSPFIADASVTLIKRGVRGEKIWHAHREHYYQRLVRMGWSHRQMVIAAYALMLVGAVAALWLLWAPGVASLITLLWLTVYLLIFITLDWRWSHRKHEI